MDDSVLGDVATVEDIDCGYLTGLMREAGYPDAKIIGFDRRPTEGLSLGGGSISRFHLTYSVPLPDMAPPTVILKECRESDLIPDDLAYPRREGDAYLHGILDGPWRRLRVPKAYRVVSRPDRGQSWIWMEDLKGAFDVEWTPTAICRAVRNIAELHAKWWGRTEELRRMPFLRLRAHAMWDRKVSEPIEELCDAVQSHPRAREIGVVYTPERLGLLKRFSHAEDLVYPHLDALPQTLLHHDVWQPNMGLGEDGRTVLIDWPYLGIGTPGSELSQLAFFLLYNQVPDFDEGMLLGSLHAGLAEDHGLPVSHGEILAGYELAFCLRWAHLVGVGLLSRLMSGEPLSYGPPDFESRLVATEAVFGRIERGARRLGLIQ